MPIINTIIESLIAETLFLRFIYVTNRVFEIK